MLRNDCGSVGSFIQCWCQRLLFGVSPVCSIAGSSTSNLKGAVASNPSHLLPDPSAVTLSALAVSRAGSRSHCHFYIRSSPPSSVTLHPLHQLLGLRSCMSSAGVSSGQIGSSKHATINSWQREDLISAEGETQESLIIEWAPRALFHYHLSKLDLDNRHWKRPALVQPFFSPASL